MTKRSQAAAEAVRFDPDRPLELPVVAPKPRRPRRRWRWLLPALVALAAAGVFAWDRLAPATPVESYITATVQLGDIEDATTAIGTLQPRDYVDVGAQISGQLSRLYVDVGDVVAEGQLLAEIEATVHRARVEAGKAQLNNLRAQLADREAQLVLARQQHERQVSLMRENATSEQALESARAGLASAAAQVDAIKAQIQHTESTLKADEANLGFTMIRAPMAGTVVSLSARQGQTLNANQQAPIILRIADLGTMTVQAQVSEADVSRLEPGMGVYFTTLGRPDRRWRGTLGKILPTPEVVNNVVLYHALFDVPNPEGELMTQMTAQVFFVSAAAESVVLVPRAALETTAEPVRWNAAARAAEGEDRVAATVQVLGEDGNVTRRAVTVGIVNRVAAEIVEGLEPGERVIVGTRRGERAPAPSAPVRRARL